MSIMDMDLMEMTTYMYRVKAVNSAGAGYWSNTASATTIRTNVAPVAGADLTAMVTEGMTTTVQSDITDADPEDTTLMYSATTSAPTIATATVDAMGEVTITGVAMGTATITVTATDSMDAYDMQDIVVTVNAAAPPAPLSVTGSDPAAGTITIEWQAIAGAVSYHALAYNSGDDLSYKTARSSDPLSVTFDGLTSGNAYVIAIAAQLEDGSFSDLVILPSPHTLLTPPPSPTPQT